MEMNKLNIFINDSKVFDYDKDIDFEESQLEFLNKMDSDMEQGIKIHGKLIPHPDTRQRATFVVMNLIKALQQGNEAILSASCAYLNHRMPNLHEVHANDHKDGIKVEFMENHG